MLVKSAGKFGMLSMQQVIAHMHAQLGVVCAGAAGPKCSKAAQLSRTEGPVSSDNV